MVWSQQVYFSVRLIHFAFDNPSNQCQSPSRTWRICFCRRSQGFEIFHIFKQEIGVTVFYLDSYKHFGWKMWKASLFTKNNFYSQKFQAVDIMFRVENFLFFISLRTFGLIYGWFNLIQQVIIAVVGTILSAILIYVHRKCWEATNSE